MRREGEDGRYGGKSTGHRTAVAIRQVGANRRRTDERKRDGSKRKYTEFSTAPASQHTERGEGM